MKMQEMSINQLKELKERLLERYDSYKTMNLSLDMSRGKPAPEQLDQVDGFLNDINHSQCFGQGGDYRNYGLAFGIPEMRKLFASIFNVDEKNVILGNNSSLNMMFDCIAQAMTHGFGFGPWCKQDDLKFLCPCPGYDRHFAITEYFGFKLIPIKMLEDGPDMDAVREYCESDDTVKGIWCVPKYSNPTGVTFSDDVVKQFAALKPAAKDFKIFWDNSYFVHDLGSQGDILYNIFDACAEYGSEDMVLEFASTSKITYPGAGVAAMAASDKNIKYISKRISHQTIGPDKINQLRHLYFFRDVSGIQLIMKQHATKIAPKFEIVLNAFNKELMPYDVAKWTNPNGGYFISLDVFPGCAKRCEQLCTEAGVKLTPAGSAFPYGKDPENKNIRIAPTFPTQDELRTAVGVLCVSVLLSACEMILEQKQ